MRPPPCSTSRITESDVTDLPEPDSPTSATVSPACTVSEISSTAVTQPSSVLNFTVRSFTARTAGAASRGAAVILLSVICSIRISVG